MANIHDQIYNHPYSKSVNQPIINWQVLVENKDKSKIQESLDWRTCFIGQLTNKVKRLKNHAPLDYSLALLGLECTAAYCSDDWKYCKELLKKIEERTNEVINGDNK